MTCGPSEQKWRLTNESKLESNITSFFEFDDKVWTLTAEEGKEGFIEEASKLSKGC